MQLCLREQPEVGKKYKKSILNKKFIVFIDDFSQNTLLARRREHPVKLGHVRHMLAMMASTEKSEQKSPTKGTKKKIFTREKKISEKINCKLKPPSSCVSQL